MFAYSKSWSLQHLCSQIDFSLIWDLFEHSIEVDFWLALSFVFLNKDLLRITSAIMTPTSSVYHVLKAIKRISEFITFMGACFSLVYVEIKINNLTLIILSWCKIRLNMFKLHDNRLVLRFKCVLLIYKPLSISIHRKIVKLWR